MKLNQNWKYKTTGNMGFSAMLADEYKLIDISPIFSSF